MTHAFNPSPWETEVGGFVSFRTARYTQRSFVLKIIIVIIIINITKRKVYNKLGSFYEMFLVKQNFFLNSFFEEARKTLVHVFQVL